MRPNRVRQILNKNMEKDTPYRRREIYHVVFLALENKQGEPRIEGIPDIIQLPRKWQNTVRKVLYEETAIDRNGDYYTRTGTISLR